MTTTLHCRYRSLVSAHRKHWPGGTGILGKTVNNLASQTIMANKRPQSRRMASPRKKRGLVGYQKRIEFFNKYLFYLDGLALYAEAECPEDERRAWIRMGWGMGRQIISQYLVEMLLQARLVQLGGAPHRNTQSDSPLQEAVTRRQRHRRAGLQAPAQRRGRVDVGRLPVGAVFSRLPGREPHKEYEIPLAAEKRRHTVLAIQL